MLNCTLHLNMKKRAFRSVIFAISPLHWVNIRIFFNCDRDRSLNGDFDRIWDWFLNRDRDRPIKSDFDRVRNWSLNRDRDRSLNRDTDGVWDWSLDFIRDWLLYCYWVWLWDCYGVGSVNWHLHWDCEGSLYRIRNWFRNCHRDFLENSHRIWFRYRDRIGTVHRDINGVRDGLSYRIRDRFLYRHWVRSGYVDRVGAVNWDLYFNRVGAVNRDSEWNLDVNRVRLRYWDLHVNWIRLWDLYGLLDNNWIWFANNNWVWLRDGDSHFLWDCDGFLYRDNNRIWSIDRDLNWKWHVLNDRVRDGFLDGDSHRDGSVYWDTDRIRHRLLDWDLDRVGDLLRVCDWLQEQAHTSLPVAVRRTDWQQTVTETSGRQGPKLAEPTHTIAVPQVKQPTLVLGRQPRGRRDGQRRQADDDDC